MKFITRYTALLIAIFILSLGDATGAGYRVGDIPNVQLQNRHNFVSNPDGILSRGAVAQIDSICYALRKDNIAEVAVVAVDQILDQRGNISDPFNFAYTLFSEWGVGFEGRDNGVGILFVGDQRQIRFVTGRGVEGVLPDAICKRIQTQYMLPYFRQGEFSQGMVSGVRAIESLLIRSELNQGGSYYPARSQGGAPVGSLSTRAILVIMMLVVFLPMVVSIFTYLSSSKCPRCGKLGMRSISRRVVSRGDNFEQVEHTFECPHCKYRDHRTAREIRDDLERALHRGVIIGGGYGAARGFRGGGGFGGGFGGGGAGSGW